jgi:hypothetical protein
MRNVTQTCRYLLIPLAFAAPAAYGLSLKNFREINAFYATATGIAASQRDVAAAYQDVRTRLPLRGNINEMTSAAVLAAVELGGAYCGAMIDTDAALPAASRRAHQAVDFNREPAAMTDAVVKQTVTAYTGLFWERAPTATELSSFVASFSALKTSSPTNAVGTRQALLILCSQAATSLDALIYD